MLVTGSCTAANGGLFDHPMARASRDGRTVSPGAFTVLRLITSSNLLAARWSISAGVGTSEDHVLALQLADKGQP